MQFITLILTLMRKKTTGHLLFIIFNIQDCSREYNVKIYCFLEVSINKYLTKQY